MSNSENASSFPHKLAAKDTSLGIIFLAIGAFYGTIAVRGLPLGTPTQLGPGMLPAILCGLLIVVGLILIGHSIVKDENTLPIGRIPWRGIASISMATIIFALTVRGAGLGPSTFIATLVASLASVHARPIPALITAILLSTLCTFIFLNLLSLPVGLIGPWLQFGDR